MRDFFNASPDEYEVIFTANASGALKLVGEAYPFRPSGVYLVRYDNHNSVNGIREFAHAKGAQVTYVPVRNPDLRLDAEPDDARSRCRRRAPTTSSRTRRSRTSAACSIPLEWVAEAQDAGWDVLLDCAAFVPTNRLDSRRRQAGLRAASRSTSCSATPPASARSIARRDKLAKLRRPWFAGGTITVA